MVPRHEIQSLMSKNCIPLDDWSGFWTNSKKKTLVVWQPTKISAQQIQIRDVKDPSLIPGVSTKYKLFKSIAEIDSEFLSLSGHRWRKFRAALNRYSSVEIRDEFDSLNDVMSLIDIWDEQRSETFAWQSIRSGRDRNFFRKFWESEKQDLWSNFFYLNGRLVGYSVVSKIGQDNCYNYLMGKNDISLKDLSLFLDFKTFERIFNEIQLPFLIDWGTSGKKLLEYKNKFPVKSVEEVYLCIIKEKLNG